MRIDIHTHAYPDKVAAQVVGSVDADLALPPVLSGRADDLVQHMQDNGFDRAVVLGVAPEARLVERTNEWLRDLAARQPRVIPFASVHPDYPDPAAELQRVHGWGFKGLKVHALFQHVEPDDPRWYRVYEAVPEDFLVLFHCGWGSAEKQNRSTPAQLAKVHRDFPRMRMVLAHWGGTDQQDGVWEQLIGQDVYFDTSCPPGLEQFDPDYLRRFISAHGADRILFGSDSPFGHEGKDAAGIESLGIDADGILGENAKRLMALS